MMINKRRWRFAQWAGTFLLPIVFMTSSTSAQVDSFEFKGDLVRYPGPWAFQLGKSAIILVSDKELIALENPDTVINMSLGFTKQESSLRQVCERAKAAGHRTIAFAFDHFFSQYRPGQEGPRVLTPDTDEYIRRIAGISKFAAQYGLGLELSLLSPLEIGPAYQKQTGESGLWLHYRKGVRDTKTGAFSVQLWRQRRWANNKGIIELPDAGVRVFAFRETPVSGTHYRVVDPRSIVEISNAARVEQYVPDKPDSPRNRVRIYGKGRTDIGSLDRVLVVQQYRTPEMDYFSPKALPYLKRLVDKYADSGVKLNALYADETHIQQDWNYFGHHDNGELALRYVTPNMSKRFAELYGPEFVDLGKYMVYMCYGQDDIAPDVDARAGAMHVFGSSPEAMRRTALFRSRYYKLLQDGVVDLFTAAKRHAEVRMGHKLESRAHATWAQSPTIDKWDTGRERMYANAYEYTSNYVWSNTVHQAAAACHDYFKWGDFLTGNGNDHCEGGWLDRDYVGLMLACSTGILNEVPYSYGAHWGMPDELSRRRMSLVNTFGAAAEPGYGMVQDMQHRDVQVLMLYPLDLVATEERFGSWMTQYGYANYVTQAKLLERGKVVNGGIEMAGRRFTTLVATFEPFPSKRLLELMKQLAEDGGKVVWSGPPPVISAEGEPILATWSDLFGVDYTPGADEGVRAPGKQAAFSGRLDGLAPQTILTDFLVDRIYPVTPRNGVEPVARVKDWTVGTIRATPRMGTVAFLGFRPRDDQSKSLGYEARWWFEILSRIGAYPTSGTFAAENDNTEVVSRTTDYLACRFPNRSTAICRHFRDTEEGWNGGFSRNQDDDAAYLKRVPPPSEALNLTDFRVNGHTLTYTGQQAVTFRVDEGKRLIAFAGRGCRSITVDGRETVFADQPLGIAWAPVPESRRVPGGAAVQIRVEGEGTVHIPVSGLSGAPKLFAEGGTPGSLGESLPCSLAGGMLSFTSPARVSGRWLYVVP